MPYPVNPNIVCCKCQRPKMIEYDLKIQKNKVILDIGSMIIIMPNGQKEWHNICSQHIKMLATWFRGGVNQIPRGIEEGQQSIEEIFKELSE